jgi:hypothetical protein
MQITVFPAYDVTLKNKKDSHAQVKLHLSPLLLNKIFAGNPLR